MHNQPIAIYKVETEDVEVRAVKCKIKLSENSVYSRQFSIVCFYFPFIKVFKFL